MVTVSPVTLWAKGEGAALGLSSLRCGGLAEVGPPRAPTRAPTQAPPASEGTPGSTVPCRGHSMVWLRSSEGCVEKPARKLMLLTPVILTEWRPLL